MFYKENFEDFVRLSLLGCHEEQNHCKWVVFSGHITATYRPAANGCPCWGISIKEGLEVTGLTHSPRRTLSNQQTHKSKSKKVLFGGAVGRSSKKQILIPFWICCFSQHGPPNQNKQRMHVQLHRLSNVKPVLEVERVAQFTLSFPKKRQRRN